VTTIRELLARPLDQPIEEIIKLDQRKADVVRGEIQEYVATPRIVEQYRTVLDAMATAINRPQEGIGVWISGFFGSGKSSFAKNLGYVLQNETLLGDPASLLFKGAISDQRVSDLVDNLVGRLQSAAIMFDVSVDRAVNTTSQQLSEVMYRVLLRELDYAEDFTIAELEIELEAEGKLDQFVDLCKEQYVDWGVVRKGAQRFLRASSILHALDPLTYPSSESWANAAQHHQSEVTVRLLAERAFELMQRRRPGQGLLFIMDEVGQYVARSADKILDLQAIVREFGQAGRNAVVDHRAPAPCWIVVTSQEKLDEVVSAIGDKRVELAKLQDSFKYHIDLSPADIREVATRRVLEKTQAGAAELTALYASAEGRLSAGSRLERTSRHSSVSREEFVQFYPYLPHFVDLSIDIMSGIRLQPGAARHLGGSNRTIIKQAYEMLVSPRTSLGDSPVGQLVTLDRVYELVEGNLSTEKQTDINNIMQRFGAESWPARVGKALALLEHVRDLPRTETNIAALLLDRVDGLSPLDEVKSALTQLEAAEFVRQADDGWKLQTATEKSWETERRGSVPLPRRRHELLREIVRDLFTDPTLNRITYQGQTFTVGLTLNDTVVTPAAKIPLHIRTADGVEQFEALATETRDRSRAEPTVGFWVAALNTTWDDLVTEVDRSDVMTKKYAELRSQGKVTGEERSALTAEEQTLERSRGRLREEIVKVLAGGRGYLNGVERQGSALGSTASEMLSGFYRAAIPKLYEKLSIGSVSLKGTEPEEILRLASLSAAPQPLLDLQLVAHEQGHSVINPEAPIAREVLGYLKTQAEYGEKVNGKSLIDHFSGLGYGWDGDVVRLVMAALLKAGAVEVTHQARKYRDAQDPQARAPFASVQAFRAAAFAPREPIDLKTLTSAMQTFAALTGDSVEPQEASIAAAFKRLAGEERQSVQQVQSKLEARGLPGQEELRDYASTIDAALAGASDDCVRQLAQEGTTIKEARDRLHRLQTALTEGNLTLVARGRTAVDALSPVLDDDEALAAAVETVGSILAAPDFFDRLPELESAVSRIERAYVDAYRAVHTERFAAFDHAYQALRGRPEWLAIGAEEDAAAESTRQGIAGELTRRRCADAPQLSLGTSVCGLCHASISQMRSDLPAAAALLADAMAALQAAAQPERPVERVRLARFFPPTLADAEEVDAALQELRTHLLTLLEGNAQIVVE